VTAEDAVATGRTPALPVDFGRAMRAIRLGRLSANLPVRVLTVSLALLALAAVAGIVAITIGKYPIGLGQVYDVLAGGGTSFRRTVVLEWRLPLAVAAVVFGAVLGIGGATFQSLTRNPLGSPDVIGFDAGAYTAVVVMILLVGSSGRWTLAGASLVGGLLTAFVVFALAYRRGIQGFRLIIVGIGVSALLGSVNAYLITRADIVDAMTVGFWGAGGLGHLTWPILTPSLVLAAAIVVAAVLLSPALKRLELGDDLAVTLGTRLLAARLSLMVVGVATVALVTAAAGPIGFIALVAPQLARRLTRSSGVSLLASAAMGAALLACAHLVSLVVAEVYAPIPVGLYTVCFGGGYLIWLLIREARRHGVLR
jgi:iron-siderophore transport system permease protein